MTSKRHWSVLIALLLVLGLLLAACVRPMPGDGELLREEAPAEAYPAPAETVGEDAAGEGYPAGEEGAEAGLVPPVDESGAEAAYPGAAEEAVEAETPAGEAAADESAEAYPVTEEEVTAEETAAEETAEGEGTEGEAAAGEAVEAEAPEGEAPEGEAAETGRTHTVASGETLSQIGSLYNINWVAIAEANGITNPNSLYPGQVLVIPDAADLEAASESSETDETAETAAEETAVEEAAAEEAAAEETTYIVQFGDTLYSISYRFGVNMMDIARENELASFDQIYAGQELIIPQATAETESGSAGEAGAGEEGAVTHVVQEGETVFTIAYKYQIIWTDLVEANEIASPYTLEVGQTLLIPSGD